MSGDKQIFVGIFYIFLFLDFLVFGSRAYNLRYGIFQSR